jgi:hypothetical protein
MVLKPLKSVWLAAFVLGLPVFALSGVCAEDSDQAALAAALKNARTTLEQGLKASEKNGKPVSAKFEIEEGKLRLSVYTMGGDGFTEVIVSPDNGAVESAEKITAEDDLKNAEDQKRMMDKATVNLETATERAVTKNAGSRAVSVVPQTMDYAQPGASVTLLRDGSFKTVFEKLY